MIDAQYAITLSDFQIISKYFYRATGSIKINLTEVLELGEQWSSSTLTNFANSLSASTTNANAGKLEGNRMFYANDYMVRVFFVTRCSLFSINRFIVAKTTLQRSRCIPAGLKTPSAPILKMLVYISMATNF